MPDPALPIAPIVAVTPNYTREFRDPKGRAYTGHVTLVQTEPPKASVEVDIRDGRVELRVAPGLYNMKAMLKDPDGVRAFICEDINVRVQEDS